MDERQRPSVINLGVRTEYSFRQTYGHLKDLLPFCPGQAIGIADFNNTYAHVKLEQLVKDKDIKPIYGIRLEVLKDPEARVRGIFGPTYVFFAKNQQGLYELNRLVTMAWKKFYYRPMIGLSDIDALSDNVIVIAENIETLDSRIDYIALTTSTHKMIASIDLPKVYLQNNFFNTPEDKEVYQIVAGFQKRGDGYTYKFENRTTPQHILSLDEFDYLWDCPDAELNTHKIADECNVVLPKAPIIKYEGSKTIESICESGAILRGVDIDNPGEYKDRYLRELNIIKEKAFGDYFLIVYDVVIYAKKTMLVGPSRGCFSPNSLVRMASGKRKAIQDVIIGNHVFDSYGVRRRVNDVFSYDLVKEEMVEIELEDGTILKCTLDHKIMTKNGWIKAGDLTSSDSVYSISELGNEYPMWLSKMISLGWPYDLAIKWKELNYIDFSDISRLDKPSKKFVKLECKICDMTKLVQHRKLVSRKYLPNSQLCADCINKVTHSLNEVRLSNSKSQLIAQNKPEQRALNSITVRFSKKGLKKHFDEYYITQTYRNLFHEMYENKCQLCNESSYLIHHISPNGASSPDNLIPLCNACHTGIHNFQHIRIKWIFQMYELKIIVLTKLEYENAKIEKSEIYKTIQLFWQSL